MVEEEELPVIIDNDSGDIDNDYEDELIESCPHIPSVEILRVPGNR